MKNILMSFLVLMIQSQAFCGWATATAIAINEDVKKEVFVMIESKIEECLSYKDLCKITINNKDLSSLAMDYFSIKYPMLSFKMVKKSFVVTKKQQYSDCAKELTSLYFKNNVAPEREILTPPQVQSICLGYNLKMKIPWFFDIEVKEKGDESLYFLSKNSLTEMDSFKEKVIQNKKIDWTFSESKNLPYLEGECNKMYFLNECRNSVTIQRHTILVITYKYPPAHLMN